MGRRFLGIFLLAFAMAAEANPFGSLVVLIPLSPGRLTGAFETDWQTTVWVHNSSDVDGTIECNGADLEQCPKVKAHSTIELQNPWFSTPGPFFLRIRSELIPPGVDENHIWVEMRTTETSTAPHSAGTEIPLARLPDFRSTGIILPHVPVNNHSRLRLRIYGLDNGTVTVRGVGLTSGSTLTAATLTLNASDIMAYRFPSYAEQLLSTAVGSDEAMRVEISSTARIWAFITVTDNESQQFTVISPGSPTYVPISVAKSNGYSSGRSDSRELVTD